MNSYWVADRLFAFRIGQRYKGIRLQGPASPRLANRRRAIWTEILFVSICHQANWDRLHEKFTSVASTQPSLLTTESLQGIDQNEFTRLFCESLGRDRLRAGERSSILRSIGSTLQHWVDTKENTWADQEIVSLGGPDGLYAWLDNVPGFSGDPLRKKSRVLVHQLLRNRLIEVRDPEQILPAVDYHVIRLYVRTGRVVARSKNILHRLLKEKAARVEFITHLRIAVEEAMLHSANSSGLPMHELNHVEWQIARSFCVRKNARCNLEPMPSKPVDDCITELSMHTDGGCPLRPECPGASDPLLRSLLDPISVRPYY